jgi:hypothetical protein
MSQVILVFLMYAMYLRPKTRSGVDAENAGAKFGAELHDYTLDASTYHRRVERLAHAYHLQIADIRVK